MGTENRTPVTLETTGYRHDQLRAVRPAEKVSFFLLGDKKGLFSEPTQKVYALNDAAAYIWCRLEERQSFGIICKELQHFGIGLDDALKYVHQAVGDWIQLGLLEPDYNFDGIEVLRQYTLDLRVADFELTLEFTSETFAKLLQPIFEHLCIAQGRRDYVLKIVEMDGLIHVFHDNRSIIRCTYAELAPRIKIHITEQVIAKSTPNVVFHAASLVQRKKSLLISGEPGAGKTTLTLRLVASGFSYAADDLVFISPEGEAIGLPFPQAVKPGSWKLLEKFRPDLRGSPVHRQPDGRRVRYIRPTLIAPYRAFPVGWIVFIRRKRGGADLRALGLTETFARLIDGSLTSDRKLNALTFNAIKRMLMGAKSFELTYSNLKQANDAIVDLCRA